MKILIVTQWKYQNPSKYHPPHLGLSFILNNVHMKLAFLEKEIFTFISFFNLCIYQCVSLNLCSIFYRESFSKF